MCCYHPLHLHVIPHQFQYHWSTPSQDRCRALEERLLASLTVPRVTRPACGDVIPQPGVEYAAALEGTDDAPALPLPRLSSAAYRLRHPPAGVAQWGHLLLAAGAKADAVMAEAVAAGNAAIVQPASVAAASAVATRRDHSISLRSSEEPAGVRGGGGSAAASRMLSELSTLRHEKEQLAKRLLAAEAQVDSCRQRAREACQALRMERTAARKAEGAAARCLAEATSRARCAEDLRRERDAEVMEVRGGS